MALIIVNGFRKSCEIMLKKISYLFIAFMFSFLCFSLNVNAELSDISDSFARFES